MNNKYQNHQILTALLVSTALLTACGGSGGGSGGGSTTILPAMLTPPASGTPPASPPPTPIVYDTAEYRENVSLSQMNIQAAYENGVTGDGIIVAVIDSGVTEVAELQGQLHSASTNIVTGNAADADDFIGHGTGIAGIIAARQDHNTNNSPFNMHGIAFGAQILNINATDAANCPDFDNCSFFNSDIADAYDYARNNGAKVINESLGSDNPSSGTLVAAFQRAVDANILIVFPAGNISPSTPAGVSDNAQLSASYAYSAGANGQVIIAGSVDGSNAISSFSYRAGPSAQNFFLVTPGDDVTAPDFASSSYVGITGTSASTAQVSGAAALLMEAFPGLSAKQVATLLFTTATDLGAPGPDVIYGRGLLNLEEAFRAQGVLSIAGSGFGSASSVGTNSSVSTQNIMLSGGAFGSGVSFGETVNDIMVLDAFDRSYSIDFSEGIYLPQASVSIEAFMNGGLQSRTHNMRLNDKTTVKLGWRHDSQFSEIDRKYFSNHLGRDKNAGDLRMAISYSLDDTQTAMASAGMSLTEMMEDYRPDDYMAPNKHGFSSLLSPTGSRAFSYKNNLSKRSSFETAYATSKINFGEEFFAQKIEVKNALLLNRFSHFVASNMLVSFDLGLLEERGSVLGAVSRGALEIGRGATTGFAGANMDIKLSEKSQFFARATYGVTSVDQSARSILGDVSTLKSYSYLVGFKSSGLLRDDDQISFTFSQPLRLAGGHAFVSNAVSRDYSTGTFTTEFNRISLNPSGAERDFEMSYSLTNFYGANVRLNLLHQLNPGHAINLPDATSVLLRFGSGF